MSEPRTEAGRRLLGKMTTPLADRYWRDWVLAIEQEAVAAERARIAEAVRGLIADRGGLCVRVGDVCSAHGEMWYTTGCEDEPAFLVAVLAIIVAGQGDRRFDVIIWDDMPAIPSRPRTTTG